MRDPYEQINRIASQVMAEHQKAEPDVFKNYSGDSSDPWLEETRKQVIFLFDSASFNSPQLFIHYIAWVKVVMFHTGAPPNFLLDRLRYMLEQCQKELEGPFAEKVVGILRMAVDEYPNMAETIPPFIKDDEEVGMVASAYLESVVKGDRVQAQETIKDAINKGLSLKDVYLKVFQSTQYEMGRLWQQGQVSVAEEHHMTEVTQEMMSKLKSDAPSSSRKKGHLVVTSVGNEMHNMGPRMVSDFLEMDGWAVIFLGANTPHQDVLSILKKQNASMLLVSATMVYNVRRVKSLISQVRADPKLRAVKVIVGGYPFNNVDGLWRTVGADAYAKDAEEAVTVVNDIAT
jgi:MerR family transcriptional regulator, light-induced transcriptional regulator